MTSMQMGATPTGSGRCQLTLGDCKGRERITSYEVKLGANVNFDDVYLLSLGERCYVGSLQDSFIRNMLYVYIILSLTGVNGSILRVDH